MTDFDWAITRVALAEIRSILETWIVQHQGINGLFQLTVDNATRELLTIGEKSYSPNWDKKALLHANLANILRDVREVVLPALDKIFELAGKYAASDDLEEKSALLEQAEIAANHAYDEMQKLLEPQN